MLLTLSWDIRAQVEGICKKQKNCDSGQTWLPVFPEDVETHVALQVDVGVVDCVEALHFGWGVRVFFTDFELKCESGKERIYRVDKKTIFQFLSSFNTLHLSGLKKKLEIEAFLI